MIISSIDLFLSRDCGDGLVPVVDAPRVDFAASAVPAGAGAFGAFDEAASDVLAGAPVLKTELGAEGAGAAEDAEAPEDAGANSEGAEEVVPLPKVNGLGAGALASAAVVDAVGKSEV